MKDNLTEVTKIVKENYSNSVWQEVYNRRAKKPRGKALCYEGQIISNFAFLSHIDSFAMSLKALGCKKGDIVLASITDTPEFFYLLFATSKLGLKLTIVHESIDQETLNELNKKNIKTMFIMGDKYHYYKDLINGLTNTKNIVVISTKDSLFKWGIKHNEGLTSIRRSYALSHNIYDRNEFLNLGTNYAEKEGYISKDMLPSNILNSIYENTLPENIIDMNTPWVTTFHISSQEMGKFKSESNSPFNYFVYSECRSREKLPKDTKVLTFAKTFSREKTLIDIDTLLRGGIVVSTSNHFLWQAIEENNADIVYSRKEYWRSFLKDLEISSANRKTYFHLKKLFITNHISGKEKNYLEKISKKYQFGGFRTLFGIMAKFKETKTVIDEKNKSRILLSNKINYPLISLEHMLEEGIDDILEAHAVISENGMLTIFIEKKERACNKDLENKIVLFLEEKIPEELKNIINLNILNSNEYIDLTIDGTVDYYKLSTRFLLGGITYDKILDRLRNAENDINYKYTLNPKKR